MLVLSLFIISISAVSAVDENTSNIDNFTNSDIYNINNIEINENFSNNSFSNNISENSNNADNSTYEIDDERFVSINDIINASLYYKNYVVDNRDIPSNVSVGEYVVSSNDFIYLMAKAIDNINKAKTSELILIIDLNNITNPTFNNFRLNATKSQYLSLINIIIKNVNTTKSIPSTVTISSKVLDYKSYSYGLSNILLSYYSNKKLPTFYIFSASILAEDDFFVQYYGKDVTFYLTSDRVTTSKSVDMNVLKKLASTLNSLGFKTKIIGVGPNMHNIAYKYGCKGKNSVLLACFSGVDVGCIEEWTGEAGSWFKNAYKGAKMIAVFYSAPYGLSSNLNKKVGQSWDANYGTALNSPANSLISHGISFIQAHSVNYVCSVLKTTYNKKAVKSVIYAPSIKFDYLSSKNLVVKLTSSSGKAIQNKTIKVRIYGNSKVYKIVTDSKGYAKLKFTGSIKTYKVNIYFGGDNTYQPTYVNTNVIITKVKSVLNAPVVKSYINKATYLTITLKDSHGKYLPNKKISVSVTGVKKVYKLTTNNNGIAKMKFSSKIKTYKVSIKFSGDSKYLSSSSSSKVIISKAPTKLDVSYVNASNKLKIHLINNLGQNLTKKTIVIKFLDTKKTYKVTTNSLGIAYLSLNKAIKKIAVLITYAGNNIYKSSSVKYSYVFT